MPRITVFPRSPDVPPVHVTAPSLLRATPAPRVAAYNARGAAPGATARTSRFVSPADPGCHAPPPSTLRKTPRPFVAEYSAPGVAGSNATLHEVTVWRALARRAALAAPRPEPHAAPGTAA